jgi:hypothetical protein
MVFDRTPVHAGEMWRSAARYGFARGFERDPVSGHKWLPLQVEQVLNRFIDKEFTQELQLSQRFRRSVEVADRGIL